MDIKDTYTTVFLKAAGQEPNKDTIKKFRTVWWQNVRNKSKGGLRLTSEALNFIEKYSQIKTYKIDLPRELVITPQILIWLDQYIDSPYFVTDKYITVMREKSAFELYLFHGDIRKLGYTKTIAKNYNQK